MIRDDEQIDDLGINSLKILQKRHGFRFGTDAVLLSYFAMKTSAESILDLCTGTGIVPLLLSAKTNAKRLCAIEIQTDIADMARRSVELNRLEGRIEVACGDLKNACDIYGRRVFDAVTCNPPYIKVGAGLKNEHNAKLISRHEITAQLSDVVRVSSMVLKEYGRLYMVHRPSRLAEIIQTMREYKIEPKRLRMVHPSADKEAMLVLIDGALLAGQEMRIEKPLIIYDKDGNYTHEMNTIYGI